MKEILSSEISGFFGTEGSGNQPKCWFNGNLIKIDSKHKEHDKEISAYIFGIAAGVDVAEYEECIVTKQGIKYHGVISKNYLQPGEYKITPAYLLEGIAIPSKMSASDYFSIVKDKIVEVSQFSDEYVDNWLMQMVVFDFLICNNDRHLTNFELLVNREGKVRFAPLFDHGQSFLGYSSFNGMEKYLKDIRKFKSLPFSTNPMKNLINLEKAKVIGESFKRSVEEKCGSIANLPIPECHRRILKYRFKDLLDNPDTMKLF